MSAVPLPAPPLATDRLLLRPWQPEDAPELLEAFRDPEVLRFSWGSDRDYTRADAVRFLQEQEAARERGEELQWALVDPGEGRLLGGASLYQLDPAQRTAAVGYWLAAAARGRGLATTAVRLIAGYAFTGLGVERLELTCAPDNTASMAVARRAGFVREGLLRSHLPFRGGRRDTVLHSLLRGEGAGAGREEGYLLDNQQVEAGQRFDALAELFDPVTFRHLTGIGLAPGWRCWEVGAGSPGVPSWLAEQVGPAGRVVASDVDTVWLRGRRGFEVVEHDIGRDGPVPGPFDLVHARLVLVHVPTRVEALAAMVAALRPGGWLVVEDADPALQPLTCPDEHGPEQRLANRLRHGFRELLAQRGAELAFGRTLPRLLRAAGLVDVQADGSFPVTGPACTALEAATVRQVRHRLVAAGLATDAEVDEHLGHVEAGRLDLTTAPLISAWGRRPES